MLHFVLWPHCPFQVLINWSVDVCRRNHHLVGQTQLQFGDRTSELLITLVFRQSESLVVDIDELRVGDG